MILPVIPTTAYDITLGSLPKEWNPFKMHSKATWSSLPTADSMASFLCVCMVYLRLLIQPKRTLIDDLAHLKMPKKSHQCQSVVFQREQGFCPLLEEDSPRVWSKSAFHVRFYSWKEPSRGFVHKRGGDSSNTEGVSLIGLAFRVEGTSLGSFWSHSSS